MEREAQRLSILDEVETSRRLAVVQPVAGWQPGGGAEYVASFVVANRFDMHSSIFCELSNCELGRHVHLIDDDTPCTIVRSQGGKLVCLIYSHPSGSLERVTFLNRLHGPETGGRVTVSQLTEVIGLSLYMDVSSYLDRSGIDTWTDHSRAIYLPKRGDYADRRHHQNRE